MISASIVGAAELTARFEEIGADMRSEMRDGLDRIAAMLQREIVEARLAGQALGVRSGRLQRSITASTVQGDGDMLSISVSSDAPYAALHEFGFRGVETVRAHVRRIRQAFGRPIVEKEIDIRAHSRTVDYPERSFLRAALRDLEASGAIAAEIDAAMGRAMR